MPAKITASLQSKVSWHPLMIVTVFEILLYIRKGSRCVKDSYKVSKHLYIC